MDSDLSFHYTLQYFVRELFIQPSIAYENTYTNIGFGSMDGVCRLARAKCDTAKNIPK
jgi:hypothetical protein